MDSMFFPFGFRVARSKKEEVLLLRAALPTDFDTFEKNNALLRSASNYRTVGGR